MGSEPSEVATKPSLIQIESKVGMRTRQPAVVFRWGAECGELTPGEARQHARRVLEAAEAADSDAFLLDFLRDQVGADLEHQVAVLGEFRRWRAKRDAEIDLEDGDVQ